jgi:signal transduction histidine kinase
MELFEAYQPRAMHSGVELELLNEKILPVIKADPDRLRRVLTNLLDNAFKFSEEGGRITIAAHEADQEITIRIEDQGTGISPKELPYIFDPYHRGHVRGKIEGFGLGLATVKTIVEGHGGHVLVESESGKGSAFTVVLPRDAKRKSTKYPLNGFRMSNQSEQGKNIMA